MEAIIMNNVKAQQENETKNKAVLTKLNINLYALAGYLAEYLALLKQSSAKSSSR
jgi:hypothetical protein